MSPLNQFALRVIVADPGETGGSVEARPIIDGHDIVPDAFDCGPTGEPEVLLAPMGPLRATGEPREVRLARACCTEGCCGALYVTIRQDGGHAIWDQWRNPADSELDLPPFRFDLREYEREVARAEQDRGWEWPARTVARLLNELLSAEPHRLGRWQCELLAVSARSWEREQIMVLLYHPGRPTIEQLRERSPWLNFRMTMAVTNEEPRAQVVRLAHELTTTDPRERGEVCGGSSDFARQLGYPWPDRRRR